MSRNDNQLESSAKVVDGNLILSLPDAINPVVWRMELSSVKASALEVRTQPNDAGYILLLKTPKGEVHDIAPYASKDDAVKALMRVSAALQSASGQINTPSLGSGVPIAQAPAPVFIKPDKSAMKWVVVFAGILVLIYMFAYLSGLSPAVVDAGSPQEAASATTSSGEDGSESGIAQSADDLLKGY